MTPIGRNNLFLCALSLFIATFAPAIRADGSRACARPAIGSSVPEPEDLRSENGMLNVELDFQSFTDANGQVRYCYAYKDRVQAPTLRVKPGDTLILRLKNEAVGASRSAASPEPQHEPHHEMNGGCEHGDMTASRPTCTFMVWISRPCATATMCCTP